MIINPIVYDENGRGSDIFSLNLSNRIVMLSGEITDETAATITSQLLYLDSLETTDISLYINSPGGSVTAGLAIYDTMRHLTSDVSTICQGSAASMAAVLLSGGTIGKRKILSHGEVMIHQPSGGSKGQASEILIAAEHMKRCKDVLTDILAENCMTDRERIEKDMDRDYWLNANEALDYGIVDDIIY